MMNPKAALGLAPDNSKQMNAMFECASGEAADTRRLQGITSWRCRYMPGKAMHGVEIASVFGNVDAMGRNPLMSKSSTAGALSKYMMHSWAEFAKDPNNELSKLGWPRYDLSEKTLILLGGANGNGVDAEFASPKNFDSFCDEY
jgi:carboxylesterase type B